MSRHLVGFDGPVIVEVRDDGASFKLVEERVYTGTKGNSWRIPRGFYTDFASIPAIVSWAVAKLGAYTLAALVHDLLCKGLRDWYKDPTTADRPTADAVDTDEIFYKIARENGVDLVTANLLWVGVRLGALTDPPRRQGWLNTAPATIGLTILYAPILLPATVLALVGRSALWLVRKVIR